MSYNGGVNFGLIGDFDALPDLEVIGEALSESIAELVALARREREQETLLDPEVAGRAANRVRTNGATD